MAEELKCFCGKQLRAELHGAETSTNYRLSEGYLITCPSSLCADITGRSATEKEAWGHAKLNLT